MRTPYDFDYSEKLIYDEERLWKQLKKMAEEEGIRCSECGEFVGANAREIEPGMHAYLHVVIEETGYGEPDRILILCDECYRNLLSEAREEVKNL